MALRNYLYFIVIPFLVVLAGCADNEGEMVSGGTGLIARLTSGGKTAVPAYGDMIVIGVTQDASALVPVMATDAPSRRTTELIFNGLVKYDKDLKLVGDLAETWEISEDRRTIRFHLRKGVKWHDGKPFTARDVECTYKTYIDPITPTPYASDFLRINDFRVVDDFTVEVKYDKPYAPALGSWEEGILPAHLVEGKKCGLLELATEPVGTGPYKFVEWTTGEKIVLEANPDYFRGRPYISRVFYRVLLDKGTAFLELKGGNIDQYVLTPMQFKRQTKSRWFQENFKKYRYPSLAYTYLAYNLQDWKFKDRRVRQALTTGIDREGIVEAVLLGLGQVVHAPYSPATMWYNHKVKTLPYSPTTAKKLLKAAGWQDTDNDGVIDKDSIPFEFTILINQGDARRKNAATIIQSNLKKLGIRVEIRVLEWAALLHNFLYKRNFDACLIGWALDYDPNQIDKWNSGKTGPHDFNWMHYQNKEVDRLLELGVSTYDPKQRKKYYDKMQEVLAEDQPCTFLWVHDALPIIHARFHGIKPAPIGIDYNFCTWFVPEVLQKYDAEVGRGYGDM